MAKEASKEAMVIPAQQSIIYVGMMYDCRTHKYIPGLKLKSKSERSPCGKITSTFSKGSDTTTKSQSKDMSGSLKLDFKGFNLDIKGSSKSNKKNSKTKENINLDCEIMTEIEWGDFNEFIPYNKKIIGYGLGTHVVGSIEYGGKARFEFELDKSEDEEGGEQEGNLTAGFKGVVNSISAGGSIKRTESEKKALEKTKFTFTADFTVTEMPQTIDDCAKMYSKISDHVGKARPHTIHLLPLSCFDDLLPKVLMLNEELVDLASEAMKTLAEQTGECGAYLEEDVATIFMPFYDEVEAVINLSKKWLERFRVKALTITKKIECGELKEKDLEDHIKSHEKSPFQEDTFKRYLQLLEDWKIALEKCNKECPAQKTRNGNDDLSIKVFANKLEASSFIHEKKIDIAVCFKLEFPKKTQFHATMYKAVRLQCEETEIQDCNPYDPDLHRDIETFAKLAKENRAMVWIFYLSGTHQSTNCLRHVVEIYEDGNLISDQDFKLPSPVTGVYVKDVTDISAKIAWENLGESPGKIYEVKMNKTAERGDQELEQYEIKEGQTDIHFTNLCAGTKYELSIRLSWDSMKDLRFQHQDASKFHPVWSKPFVFKTKLPGPKLDHLGNNRFRVTWKPKTPKTLEYVCKFEITKGRNTQVKKKSKETNIEFTLEGNGLYQIWLSVFNKEGTCEERYKAIDLVIKNANKLPNLRAELKEHSPVKNNETPTVYLLPMNDIKIKLRKGKQIGTFRPYMEERIVLVLGTSSERRKRWMNLLVSSLLGVKAIDEYYFAVSMETAGPRETATYHGSGFFIYRICQVDGFDVPYTLTIVEVEDLPKPVLQSEELLHKHVNTILNKLGPGFKYIDAFTVVCDKNHNLEHYKENFADMFKSQINKDNVTFYSGDMQVEDLEAVLAEQRKYLIELNGCEDPERKKLRFCLWHACCNIQTSLIRYLCSENKRNCILKYIETGEPIMMEEDRPELEYENLLPEIKALNCTRCISTCQPICTNEEAGDTKKCAIFTTVPKNEDTVHRCRVCPEECGIKDHRIEEEIIVDKSTVVKVTTDDLIPQNTNPLISSQSKGALIGPMLETIKVEEEHLKKQIQNGLKIFTELYPHKTLKDLFGHLLSYISEDNKASKEGCLVWIERERKDPGAIRRWNIQGTKSIYKCDPCFHKYGEKRECLAKVPQKNFLIPSFGKEKTENNAERLSPMKIWVRTKNELKFEKQGFSSILQAYEFKHAQICQCREIEKEIIATEIPRKIKSLANNIKNCEQWEEEKEDIFLAIIRAAVRDKDFRKALTETGSMHIGYLGGSDDYLGTGLDRKHSQNLNPRMWTGLNKYGELLMEVRDNM